jgi:hypothetical protein
MISRTTPEFRSFFAELPQEVRDTARKQYRLWANDPWHPSLHFKKIGRLWSVRVSREYRAIAYEENGEYTWVWIGSHGDYDKLVKR